MTINPIQFRACDRARAAAKPQARTQQGASAAGNVRFSSTDWKTPTDYRIRMILGGEPITTAVRLYGNPQAKNVIFCAHGWTRNGHDFDYLARKNAGPDTLVVVPDFVGRGDSDYFRFPLNLFMKSKYDFPNYVDQATQLIDHFNLHGRDLTWIGTSMGGIVGMKVASVINSPVKRLILNDIGPCITHDAFDTLTEHVNEDLGRKFRDLDEAKEYFKKRLSGYGKLDDRTWRHITETSLKYDAIDQSYKVHYDPRITDHALLYKNTLGLMPHWSTTLVDFWNDWRRIKAPTLAIRGADSNFLTPETLRKMVDSRDNVTAIVVPETAHAPSLMTPQQVAAIREWMEKN